MRIVVRPVLRGPLHRLFAGSAVARALCAAVPPAAALAFAALCVVAALATP